MTIVQCPKCGAKNRIDARAQHLQPKCGRCGQPLSAANSDGHPIELTDATFTAQLSQAADRPLLVDCWAPWCGPCRLIAPTIEHLASQANGQYVVAKLNVDENPRTAQQFNIASIPTLLIFKRGRLVDQMVGLQRAPAIEAQLQKHLS
jgi:thioredoxin